MKKRISVLIPTYNEEENVVPLSEAIVAEFQKNLPQYEYEIVFIDNDSTDTTRDKIRMICKKDQQIKAIFNAFYICWNSFLLWHYFLVSVSTTITGL